LTLLDPSNDGRLANLWEDEYARKGIPSSFRPDPSGSLVDALMILDSLSFKGMVAVDIGCGTGRNSLYLASRGYEVYSLDIAETVVRRFADHVTREGVDDRIHVFCRSVTEPWPISRGVCDLAADLFCYKHVIAPSQRTAYRRELASALRSGGYFLLTLAGTDDGYYGPLLSSSPDRDARIIIDPANSIPSVLYDAADIKREFGDEFEIAHYEHKEKSGRMHDAEYLRSTHFFIFKRR